MTNGRVTINTGEFEGMIRALEKANPEASRYSLIRDALRVGLQSATQGMEVGPGRKGGRPRTRLSTPAEIAECNQGIAALNAEIDSAGCARLPGSLRDPYMDSDSDAMTFIEGRESRLGATAVEQVKSEVDGRKVANLAEWMDSLGQEVTNV